MNYLDGFLWLLLLTGPLFLFQTVLHKNVQAVFLLITRRADISFTLFSILFFPGILLHESSHYLVARLLGVRTGKFSLFPRVIQGSQAEGAARLQLGYVETASTDLIRDGLIGAAPLLFGGVFITYAGLSRLGMHHLWESLMLGSPEAFRNNILNLLGQPDFWLWLYLIFVVSSTMLPSASDRRAWLPLILVLGLVLGLVLIAGAGPWLMAHLAPPLNQALLALDIVLGISLAVHVVFLIPILLLKGILSRFMGMKVE